MHKVYGSIPGAAVNSSLEVSSSLTPLTTAHYSDAAGLNQIGHPQWLWDDVVTLVISETGLALAAHPYNYSEARAEDDLCDHLSVNASAIWLVDRVLRAIGTRELRSPPVDVDSSVLSAYVNLSSAFAAAQQRTASDLVAVAAASQSGVLDAAVRDVCRGVLSEPACGLIQRRNESLANASVALSNSTPFSANESAAILERHENEQCRITALSALRRGWNATVFGRLFANISSASRSARTTTGAEFYSSGGVKSAVLSTHYDLLILTFNGDVLDAQAPSVSATPLAALLPPSSDLRRPADAVGLLSTGNASNGSTLGYAASLNSTEREAAASRRRDDIRRLAPLAAVGEAAFSVLLSTTLFLPNASHDMGSVASLVAARHHLFNATILRRAKVIFQDSELNSSLLNTSSATALNCSFVRNSSQTANQTANLSSAWAEQSSSLTGSANRRLRSILASNERQNAVSLRSSKSVFGPQESQSIRRARAAADEALQRLAQARLSGSAHAAEAKRGLVASAWAAVKEAVAAEAAASLSPMSAYADIISAAEDGLGTPRRGRRLEDTYADSLVFTTRLIASKLGRKSSRRVPAHMPHMIDRVISAWAPTCRSGWY